MGGELLDFLGLGVEVAGKFPRCYPVPQEIYVAHECGSSVWKRPIPPLSQPMHPSTGQVWPTFRR